MEDTVLLTPRPESGNQEESRKLPRALRWLLAQNCDMGAVQHRVTKPPPGHQPGKPEGPKIWQVQRDEGLGQGHTPSGNTR